MLVDIDLHNKKALVIGCGKVGSKKARKLYQAGMKVSCLSLTFDEKIKLFDIELIEGEYNENYDLSQYDLIYACSDDEQLNIAIVDRANKLGLLTASSTSKAASNFKLVRSRMLDNNIEAAVFSNGKYLFLPKAILKDLKTIYNHKYAGRMGMLSNLRKYIKTLDLNTAEKHYILDDLMQASCRELKFYTAAINKDPVKLMVFHGSDNTMAIDEIMNLLSKLEANIYTCFIKKEIDDSDIFKANRIISLDHILKNLNLLKIRDVKFLPMLVDKGYFYEQIKEKVHLEDLPISKNRLDKMLNPYHDKDIIILLHGNKKESIIKKMCSELNYNTKFLTIYDDESTNKMAQKEFLNSLDKTKEYVVIPFFMLNGTHLNKDVLAFIAYCENNLVNIDYKLDGLINNEEIIEYIKTI